MSKSYEKGDAINILVEKEEVAKSYILEDLKAKKLGLENQLAEINALITKAEENGVEELPSE
tara:strand:+ start:261 stop:446 length:186 start_codon:yes stop_codon:yes gene_type:complete